MSELEVVIFSLEEMESFSLNNVLGLSQIDSAKKMNTSQSTFQRLFCCAQRKLSKAIIEGKAIKIITE